MSWKKSVLLTCQILGLLVNTLAAGGKHPVLNRDNLTRQIQIQLSRKQKTFSQFLAAFLKSRLNFKYFQKKMTLIALVLWKLRTPKPLSDQCLKRPVSEHRSRSKMVDVPKHCWNLRHSTFIIFINDCQVSWVGKSLSYWHGKSWCCLLIHWLPMKNIIFLIETI